jgi:hypothetical protein
VSNKIRVVCIQKISDKTLLHQSTGLEPSEVEDSPTSSETKVHPNITIMKGEPQNSRQIEGKQGGSWNVTLFNAIVNVYLIRELTIEIDAGFHGAM